MSLRCASYSSRRVSPAWRSASTYCRAMRSSDDPRKKSKYFTAWQHSNCSLPRVAAFGDPKRRPRPAAHGPVEPLAGATAVLSVTDSSRPTPAIESSP
jgi:hypothetical protein